MSRVPEYKRRAEASEGRRRGMFVGFLACEYRGGRLLKVAQPDTRKVIRVRCPVEGCPMGEHETGNALPRTRRRGEVCDVSIEGSPLAPPPDYMPDDDDLEPDATELEAIEADAAETPKPRPPRRASAVVLAAVPTERTPAHEIAKALGYGDTDALVRRLERINELAEAAGEVAPVMVAKSGSGNPVQIRRVAAAAA